MRKSFLVLVTLIGSALIALLFVLSQHRQPELKVSASSGSQDASEPASADPANHRALDAMASTPAHFVSESESRAQTEPGEKAAQLVKTLSEINLQAGGVTAESADQWKRNLEQLIEQGKAAVPVLEQFFQANGNIRFDSVPGGDLLGESTLRMAFIKVLFDIPTPDNVELQERLLQTTNDPDEIALLARQLELQEPGEYRDVIIQAANVALQMAQNGGLQGRDASPLTTVLTNYGSTAVK
jgi:hypothetical protein